MDNYSSVGLSLISISYTSGTEIKYSSESFGFGISTETLKCPAPPIKKNDK
jgi:hypothetical protein